jgi:hypothetical protein
MSEEIKQKVEKVRKESAQPTASASLADGSLAEMVYRPEENRTMFCIFRGGEIRYEPSLTVGGQRLVPYSPGNNLLRNEVVLFSSDAAEYASEERLVEEIRAFIHRYVDVSPLFEQIYHADSADCSASRRRLARPQCCGRGRGHIGRQGLSGRVCAGLRRNAGLACG